MKDRTVLQPPSQTSGELARAGAALYRRGVWALVGAFVAFFAFRVFKALHVPSAGLASMAVFLWLASVGRRWLTLGRRMQAAALVPDTPPARDTAVLYLRGFGDDEATARPSGTRSLAWFAFNVWTLLAFKTEEEQLVSALGKVGPIVAVGRPGEPLPQLGAHRMYLRDAEWQPVVSAWMRHARMVAIRASLSPGVRWELAEAVACVDPTRLLLLVSQSGRRYVELRQALGPTFPEGLPDRQWSVPGFGTIRGIVWFEPDWRPHYAPVRPLFLRAAITVPFEAGVTEALKPVLTRGNIRYDKPRLTWYGTGGAVLAVGMVVAWVFALLG